MRCPVSQAAFRTPKARRKQEEEDISTPAVTPELVHTFL
jgi:hypothetical protein